MVVAIFLILFVAAWRLDAEDEDEAVVHQLQSRWRILTQKWMRI